MTLKKHINHQQPLPILFPVEIHPYGNKERSKDSSSQIDSIISKIWEEQWSVWEIALIMLVMTASMHLNYVYL